MNEWEKVDVLRKIFENNERDILEKYHKNFFDASLTWDNDKIMNYNTQTTVKEAVENYEPKFQKGLELCNRTACQTHKKVYMYNKTMEAYYCVSCARQINSGMSSTNKVLCVEDPVKHQYEISGKKITWKEWKEKLGM